MISKENAPVAWAALMYELEDAHEHLAALISEMENQVDYDEVNLRIDLGHVFSHLNRAWYRRNIIEDLTEEQWLSASQFPNDLAPT